MKKFLARCSSFVLIFFALSHVAAAALADDTVNQGAPGNRGSWPVKIVGTNSLDGGPGTNTVTTFNPAATTTSLTLNATPCTTAGGASCTIIYASFDYGPWPNVTITLRNSGANPIDNVLVEWSPNNSNFEVWDSTTFASLAAGASSSIAIAGNSRRYLRIEARAAAATTAVVTITANDG